MMMYAVLYLDIMRAECSTYTVEGQTSKRTYIYTYVRRMSFNHVRTTLCPHDVNVLNGVHHHVGAL